MKFFVTCAKGTEGALRRELADLRIRAPKGDRGGVSFEGPFSDGMKACLWSRVGMRVLMEVGAFRAGNADELYDGAHAVDWREHLDARHTLAVTASVQNNPALSHSGFVALKVKDAIVDSVRDRLGARPDVDVKDPDVSLFLHLNGAEAKLFLDLAGEPLHRRGYRLAMTDAPLKESLAAAVLALGGVPLDLPFVDPMAGSGTLAIEHALRARHLAPGAARRFGFERWPSRAHASAWQSLKEEARAKALPRAPAPILARDVDPKAAAAARRNSQAAGVADDVRIETGDLRTLRPLPGPGALCVNPPYGERLDAGRPPTAREPDPLRTTYEDLAHLFDRLPGWHLAVLTGTPLLGRVYPRRAAISHRLWNGPLEVRLLVWPRDR